MLQDAHKGLEAMSRVASAVKDERWGDAEQGLRELLDITNTLTRQVGDKQRETMMVPKPDRGDRE